MFLKKLSSYILLLFTLDQVTADQRLCSTEDGFLESFFSVFENSPNGTLLGKLDFVGNTDGKDQNIVLHLDGKGAICGGKLCESWIYFDNTTQVLRLRVDDDFMLDNDGSFGVDIIEVYVVCSAPRYNIHGVEVTVTIKVEDLNDNDPMFTGEPYIINVNEMTPVGTSVFNLTSSDLDKTSHRSYYVTPGSVASDYFAVEAPASGNIKLTQKLDYETLITHSLELGVEIRDVGRHQAGQTRTKRTIVTINVKDGDDQPPAFEPCTKVAGKCVNPVYHATINRFTRSNMPLVLEPSQLFAVDPDRDIRQPISYSLVTVDPPKYEDWFSVDQDSGGVRLKRSLPMNDEAQDIEVYVQARQNDNELMSAIAKVQVHVRMVDTVKPSILNTNLSKSQVGINSNDDRSFVRTLDGSMVQILVKDNAVFSLKFSLDTISSNYFEVTPSGYVVSKNQEILNQNQRLFQIQIRAENTKSVNNDTRYSDPLFIQVEVLVNTTLAQGCSEPQTFIVDSMSCLAAVGVFVSLFIICIPVIIVLVIKMRKYKAISEEASKQPYMLSQSFGKKYDGFGYLNNSGFKDDATSFTSSAISHKRSMESGIDGHVVKAQVVDDEVPHIAPLDVVQTAKKSPQKDNVAAIIPYQHSTPTAPTQTWNLDRVQHPIDKGQVRIEEWLEEGHDEMCAVGEINTGTLRSCFIRIYTDSYKGKKMISSDVISMSHVIHDRSCAHPNIVKFYGAYTDKDALHVVHEYVASSDLCNFLISSRMLEHSAVISTLSGSQLTNFVIGISDGLSFLHENNVVHGSLRAQSIRINDRLVPKISGCCGNNNGRLRSKNKRWAAPEYLASKIYDEKSDVWSLAVVAWEILSLGGTPFAEVGEEKIASYIQRQLETGGSLFPVTRNTTKRLWMLLQSCWAEDPQDRPQVTEILTKLKKMKEASNAITVARPPGYHFFPTTSP